MSCNTRGATSLPSSIASLNSAGVLSTRPHACSRYSGTGSVTATPAPACAALIRAWAASSVARCRVKAAALLRNVAASAGSAADSASTSLPTSLATVGRSYQTCSFRLPAGADLPEMSTTLSTVAEPCAEASMVSMKSS